MAPKRLIETTTHDPEDERLSDAIRRKQEKRERRERAP
jgi:hypothetical protein